MVSCGFSLKSIRCKPIAPETLSPILARGGAQHSSVGLEHLITLFTERIFYCLVVRTIVYFPNSWDEDPTWLIFFRGIETST